MKKKTQNWLIKLTLLLLLLPNFASAGGASDNNLCYNPDWAVTRGMSSNGHHLAIYKVPTDYTITATNVSCILVKEFLANTTNLPNKAVIGLISKDGRVAFLAKWSLEDDYLMFIEATITPLNYRTMGSFTIYPQPLKRIKDIMVANKLPKPNSLPLHLRAKFKTNYVEVSVFQLRALLNGTY